MALALSVVITIAVAQEVADPSCLLQTKQGQQIVEIPGWTRLCGDCECPETTAQVEGLADGEACAAYCSENEDSQVITFNRGPNPSLFPSTCRCCPSPPVQSETLGGAMYTKDAGTEVIGDPHIKTLDGRHYTLLSQGSFLLWRLGMETELHSGSKIKKSPVDWQIYTHYSGHQSFTKGLLLADMSGGSLQQALEMTSQKCEWRARKTNDQWMAVSSESALTLDRDASTFNLLKTNGVKYHNRIQLNMSTKDGQTQIALLTVSCRPNHNLNLRITMKRRGDEQHVEGEAKVARKGLSTLQTATSTSEDSEFKTQKTWQDLGGSDEAAAYLHSVDESRLTDSKTLSSLQTSTFACQDRGAAEKICSKHLEPVRRGMPEASFKDFFSDCVFDVCGAGETAAELAAELLSTA